MHTSDVFIAMTVTRAPYVTAPKLRDDLQLPFRAYTRTEAYLTLELMLYLLVCKIH